MFCFDLWRKGILASPSSQTTFPSFGLEGALALRDLHGTRYGILASARLISQAWHRLRGFIGICQRGFQAGVSLVLQAVRSSVREKWLTGWPLPEGLIVDPEKIPVFMWPTEACQALRRSRVNYGSPGICLDIQVQIVFRRAQPFQKQLPVFVQFMTVPGLHAFDVSQFDVQAFLGLNIAHMRVTLEMAAGCAQVFFWHSGEQVNLSVIWNMSVIWKIVLKKIT